MGQVGTFNSVGIGVDDQRDAQTFTSLGFFIGEFAGSVLPA